MNTLRDRFNSLRSSLTNWQLRLGITRMPVLAALVALPVLVSMTYLPSHTSAVRGQSVSELPLQLPPEQPEPEVPLATDAPMPDAAVTSNEKWLNLAVNDGDTLGAVFKRAGVDTRDMYALLNSSKEAKQLAQVTTNQQLSFLVGKDKHLQKLKVIRNRLESTEFARTDTGFTIEHKQLLPEVRYAFAKAIIDSSLFETGSEAGLSDNVIMQLASIFGWDVDFALDIRKGDNFAIVYEELFLNGSKIGDGNIVSAEFTNQGKTYQAVRYTDSIGLSNYYTPDGASMRKAFLRTPVDFTRISSGFSLHRKHPILNTIRAHKGTDYAAPMGTPVKAAGDGRVMLAGRKGGYGNVVEIDHGQTYQTVYGHLSKFGHGIKVGSHVKQGQIIGYVGMSGLATGPHLHYEFHINGTVRNPMTVKLPTTASIMEDEKPRFYAQTQKYMLQLAGFTRKAASSQIALAE